MNRKENCKKLFLRQNGDKKNRSEKIKPRIKNKIKIQDQKLRAEIEKKTLC